MTTLISVVAWFFSSGYKLVWVSQDLVLCLVASQYVSEAHLEILNHLVVTPFQDVRHSVQKRQSPNAPDCSISSGGGAFWHI